MTSSTADSFFAPANPVFMDGKRGGKRRGRWIWLISILAHAVLIILVVAFSSISLPSKQRFSPPISAKLIIAAAPSKPAPSVINTRPDVQEAVLKEKKQEDVPESIHTPVPPVKAESPSLPINRSESFSLRPTPNQKPKTALKPKQVLKNYFNQRQTNQVSELAEQAAQNYQHQRVSPVISDSRKNQAVEDENNAPAPVNVNCSNSVNKTVALFSSWTGGRLKCTQRSAEFNKFIEARTMRNGSQPAASSTEKDN